MNPGALRIMAEQKMADLRADCSRRSRRPDSAHPRGAPWRPERDRWAAAFGGVGWLQDDRDRVPPGPSRRRGPRPGGTVGGWTEDLCCSGRLGPGPGRPGRPR